MKGIQVVHKIEVAGG